MVFLFFFLFSTACFFLIGGGLLKFDTSLIRSRSRDKISQSKAQQLGGPWKWVAEVGWPAGFFLVWTWMLNGEMVLTKITATVRFLNAHTSEHSPAQTTKLTPCTRRSWGFLDPRLSECLQKTCDHPTGPTCPNTSEAEWQGGLCRIVLQATSPESPERLAWCRPWRLLFLEGFALLHGVQPKTGEKGVEQILFTSNSNVVLLHIRLQLPQTPETLKPRPSPLCFFFAALVVRCCLSFQIQRALSVQDLSEEWVRSTAEVTKEQHRLRR